MHVFFKLQTFILFEKILVIMKKLSKLTKQL